MYIAIGYVYYIFRLIIMHAFNLFSYISFFYFTYIYNKDFVMLALSTNLTRGSAYNYNHMHHEMQVSSSMSLTCRPSLLHSKFLLDDPANAYGLYTFIIYCLL